MTDYDVSEFPARNFHLAGLILTNKQISMKKGGCAMCSRPSSCIDEAS